ncbi:hypothetical protein MTR67_017068 [Solanum verrucosum]|uniref:Protein kinase domain-containing protein n=1 Tax=Solanum verrucosum TaxID=315347 RepID=A0AAF0QIB9_SOLVR|nr:hypothetical protein MTR67_017068 [Solanum verrucosum]
MFYEMSSGVFIKELEDTSSASSLVADLEDIQSPKVFNELFHSCYPKIVAEVQSDTPIKMLDEEASGPECSRVQLGEMWRGPWYVPELRVLNLGNNSLTGIIPPYVGNATKLMNFDLYENRVSGNIPKEIGTIPKSLEKFSYLKSINVSFNDLEGEIPSGGVFANSTLQSFLGNKAQGGFARNCYSSGYFFLSDILVGYNLDNETTEEREVQRCREGTGDQDSSISCNGSVENWLYRKEFHLNLLQRVSIILDVAVAIEYLHHGHNTPIVHCDLKPDNVLLDEDMVAHIGDFGISKILAVS